MKVEKILIEKQKIYNQTKYTAKYLDEYKTKKLSQDGLYNNHYYVGTGSTKKLAIKDLELTLKKRGYND